MTIDETIQLCIRQFDRPNRQYIKRVVDSGDCYICEPDESNKKCPLYYKINVQYFEVISDVQT